MSVLPGVAQTLAMVFWLLTAFYAVLASQAFAYEQFLRPELVPAVAWFARQHQVICAGVFAFYLMVHLRTMSRDWRSRAALAIVGCTWTVNAVGLLLVPLVALSPGANADAAVMAALVTVLLIAVVDVVSAQPLATTPPSPRHASDFVMCLASAGVATLISAAIGFGRGAPFTLPSATGIVTSGLLHLVLFVALFLVLTAARSVAAIAGSRRFEGVAVASLMTGAIFLFLWRSLFPTIVSSGPWLLALSGAFALSLSFAVTARGLRASSREDDALQRVTAALSPRVAGTWPGVVAWLAVLGGAAWLFAKLSGTVDWNFILANLGVAVTWVLVVATFARFVQIHASGRAVALVAATGIVLMLNIAWTNAALDRPATSSESVGQTDTRSWNSLDPAARYLAETTSRTTATADEGLVDLLQKHTNVPSSVHVAPVDVSLGSVGAVAPYRPHIFLFVIDSLRRDYVGAYNKAVSFTPALDVFARENVAFGRAFTRYGATGLAVPSIWTGGLLLHKQYVTPFAPMNTLSKLLVEQDYAQWIGMDHIMETILPASERREPLDVGRMIKDFRLCRTLDEIRARLAGQTPVDGPVFAYTLPQDIHVSAIAREGRSAIDSESFEGFDAPVTSRIKAFDRCFGEFVADLKARNLYEDSVVIVTSDHGDSLGEGGRMGHAYTLFPEIVQIPLLVHLPTRLASALEPENEGPVFSTDITPTLYALLGVHPRQPRSFFGRPLFRARGSRPRDPERRPPVVAASYGAVYGVLVDSGRTLYVLDAINIREHAFALDGSGPGRALTITPQLRDEGQGAIRATVEEIAGFYGFKPAP